MAKVLKIIATVVGAVALIASGIGMLAPAVGFLGLSAGTWTAIGAIASMPSPAVSIGAQTIETRARRPGLNL